MLQCGSLKCPECNRVFTKINADTEVEVIGRFDRDIHDVEYYKNPGKYANWFETKCQNKKCKAIIVYKKIA